MFRLINTSLWSIRGLFSSHLLPLDDFLFQKITCRMFVSVELTLNPPEGILAGEHLCLNRTKLQFHQPPFNVFHVKWKRKWVPKGIRWTWKTQCSQQCPRGRHQTGPSPRITHPRAGPGHGSYPVVGFKRLVGTPLLSLEWLTALPGRSDLLVQCSKLSFTCTDVTFMEESSEERPAQCTGSRGYAGVAWRTKSTNFG